MEEPLIPIRTPGSCRRHGTSKACDTGPLERPCSCAQEYNDWPLEPPRICGYALGEIAKLGYGPTARHEKWKTDNKLVDEDPCVVEHEVLSEAFELPLVYDQVDDCNLVCLERLARRMQFIEEGSWRTSGSRR